VELQLINLLCSYEKGEENISPSKPYSCKFNLSIDPDLHRELSIEAAQEGVSLNDLTEHLIKLGLSHKHQEPTKNSDL
jgi:predicted HicB family RNase H-like nuclease